MARRSKLPDRPRRARPQRGGPRFRVQDRVERGACGEAGAYVFAERATGTDADVRAGGAGGNDAVRSVYTESSPASARNSFMRILIGSLTRAGILRRSTG